MTLAWAFAAESEPLADSGAARYRPARRILEEAVREKAFPGCAAAVGTSREVLWEDGVGGLDYESRDRATPATIYDLASLTKVVGTTLVILALVRDGKLNVTDLVCRHLPPFAGGGRETVTIEDLLCHCGGLPAWRPLYEGRHGYEEVLAAALATPLERPPRTSELYSDLGFILLGEIAARAGGEPLDALERKLVALPCSLRSTTRKLEAADFARVAPTERRQVRQTDGSELLVTTRGVVHDENAAAADGRTGHAGLFSTADDLARLASQLLLAYHGESNVFPQELARKFLTRRNLVPGSSRALGWDTPARGSSAGDLLGERSFGHTGFTGTSIWIDPDRDLYVILLTNRVHPSRENSKIAAVRRRFADAVVLCREGKLRRL